jgi:hypothetical protein
MKAESPTRGSRRTPERSLRKPIEGRHPVAGWRSLAGFVLALLDAYIWPSEVWIRLRLEAEERLRRYARGEDV